MKNSEIRELTDQELTERIDTEKAMLLKLKLNHTVTPLDNPHKISAQRHNVARMMTELRKRQIEAVQKEDKQ
jgi:large subunit ribosomal protein L29